MIRFFFVIMKYRLLAPHHCSENTKNVLLSSAYVNLCCKDSTKFTKEISSLCKRVLLSGPAGIILVLCDHQSFQLATYFAATFVYKSTFMLTGSEIYQELLVKALTKSFNAKLLIIDYSLLSGVSLLTILLPPPKL